MKRETISKIGEHVWSGFADKPTLQERRQLAAARKHGAAALLSIRNAIHPPDLRLEDNWNPEYWERAAVRQARAAFRNWRQFRGYTEP